MSTAWLKFVSGVLQGEPDDPFVHLLVKRLGAGYRTRRASPAGRSPTGCAWPRARRIERDRRGAGGAHGTGARAGANAAQSRSVPRLARRGSRRCASLSGGGGCRCARRRAGALRARAGRCVEASRDERADGERSRRDDGTERHAVATNATRRAASRSAGSSGAVGGCRGRQACGSVRAQAQEGSRRGGGRWSMQRSPSAMSRAFLGRACCLMTTATQALRTQRK
jgi:hypothetical protein